MLLKSDRFNVYIIEIGASSAVRSHLNLLVLFVYEP